jgi:hypothetical protein
LREAAFLHGRIRIHADGVWTYDGRPMVHEAIRRRFQRSLRRLADGRHVVELDGQWCEVVVEDTPLFVERIRVTGDSDAGEPETIVLELDDGAEEPLDPGTLRLVDDNRLYCAVRGGRLRARFKRRAWLQIAERLRLEGPPGAETVHLLLGGREIQVSTDGSSAGAGGPRQRRGAAQG